MSELGDDVRGSERSYERELGRIDEAISSLKERVNKLEILLPQEIASLRKTWKQDLDSIQVGLKEQATESKRYSAAFDEKLNALIANAKVAQGQRDAMKAYHSNLRWLIGVICGLLGAFVTEMLRLAIALHFPGVL